MEAFKVEIIKEVRKEFQKMKQEIIDGIDMYIVTVQIFNVLQNINAKMFALCEIFYISSCKNRTE